MMDDQSLGGIEVIIPNLHRRYSGVTATNRMIAPRLARLLPAAWLGPDAPDGIARLRFRDLLRLRNVPGKRPRIWHARRNDEMLAGLLLKALGWPLTLVFTSAAQRHHTRFTRYLIARMDGVIATSQASASYLQRPAQVIHHGVDTDLYRPPADRAAMFAATGLPGKYAIGCFGRVREQKGTDVFVDAMCELLPRYPDFTAVIVGAVTVDQQGFERALRTQVEAAGLSDRVLFFGELPIAEVPLWYQRITIYAFTSRNEGFGLTLLEAMAAGNALVAARAGAAGQVVIDGQTGTLVPPGDVAALAAALEPLMRDPQQAAAMGVRARARALADFGVDSEAATIAAFYEKLGAGEPPMSERGAAASFHITPVRTADDLAATIKLFRVYVASLGIDLSYQDFDGEMAAMPGKYAPPAGELLLARDARGKAVGCVGLRQIEPQGCCEMKRLYVSPEMRGSGLGKILVDVLVREARRIGYREMRLDTLPSMTEAIALYRKAGFEPMEAYYKTPVAGTIFLRRVLG